MDSRTLFKSRFFPIAVWLQDPAKTAAQYKEVGVNIFLGLWQGPTAPQLDSLASISGMTTMADQNNVALNYAKRDGLITGYTQDDEPDNAQWNSTTNKYDPCINPAIIQALYKKWKTADATRPIYLNLGRGVADTNWIGRGTCTGKTNLYTEYAKGADILSFDIYPVNENVALDSVAVGVDNLYLWSNGTKPVWAFIEASNQGSAPTGQPTPVQIKAEVWFALVHQARGIQYFCHQFNPTFVDDACIVNANYRIALQSINAQIHSLARALNSKTLSGSQAISVRSSNAAVRVDTLTKNNGTYFCFAVARQSASTTATFTLPTGVTASSVEVIDENRNIPVRDGAFQDDFANYGPHLYRLV